MNLQELQKQIINKQLDNLYVFIGEEIAIQKIYINKIAEVKNLEIQYVEEYKQIYNSLKVNNLFNTKKLYIVLDDLDILKQEKVWEEIDTNGNIIIFKYNNIDKRNKFYKFFEKQIVEFNKLSDEVLIKYIQKELPTLNEENCKKLIDIGDSNYNQILMELDKLLNYQHYLENEDYHYGCGWSNSHFEKLDEQGAFHKEISDITFEFVEKVLKRDIKKVYDLYKKLKLIGESNIKLLSLLYNNFKIVLLIQSCKSSDICKTTGLQYYQVKYNQDKLNYYTAGELVYILRKIQQIESGIKQGTIDEVISLDYLLVNIL